MKRYEDWDVRLFEEVEKVKNIPFAYGVHDCALLASHLAYVMTGVDIAGGAWHIHNSIWSLAVP